MQATKTTLSINGQRYDVEPDNALTSLNDYIRLNTRFKGTKLACGEGGCGACAVEVRRADPATGQLATRSINSCLCPVGSLHGAAISTVEAIGNSADGFHPVQEAFAQHSASQCGYCTPGFVVACHSKLQELKSAGHAATAEELVQGLDGNLCRCTGYRPIMDACKSLAAADLEDLCSASCQGSDALPEWLTTQTKVQPRSRLWQRSTADAGAWLEDAPGQQLRRPSTVAALLDDLATCQAAGASVALLAGNTGAGVYHEWPEQKVLLDVKGIPELHSISLTQDALVCGAAVTLTQVIEALRSPKQPLNQATCEGWQHFADHMQRIAGTHVRNAATLGGHFGLCRSHALESDVATLLLGLGGRICLATKAVAHRWIDMEDFLSTKADYQLNKSAVITAVCFPKLLNEEGFWSEKVAQRYWNSHAFVNMAVKLSRSTASADAVSTVTAAQIAVGIPTIINLHGNCGGDKVAWRAVRCRSAESSLVTGGALDASALTHALEQLQADIHPGTTMDAKEDYYRTTAEGLLFRILCRLIHHSAGHSPLLRQLLAAPGLPKPDIPTSSHDIPSPDASTAPVGQPVEKDRVRLQASGEAVYTSDIGVGSGELFAALVGSSQALATITSIDPAPALAVPGVVAFIGPQDIPKEGSNTITVGMTPATIFAEGRVEYVAQPLGIIVATTPAAAAKACKLVAVQYGHPKELGQPLLTLEAGIAAGSFFPDGNNASGIMSTRREVGNAAAALAAAKHTIKGARYRMPSQSHFYMEPQAAVAQPDEAGTMTVHCATQSLDTVQSSVAAALGVPMSNITAVCRRVGGAFGGKVSRCLPIACSAAIAANKLHRPVRYVLNRNDDFQLNAGRDESLIDYDVGFDDDGNVTALVIRGWFLCGADLDLGNSDMEVLTGGIDQCYTCEGGWSLDMKLVRTNLAPRTIMRGPGFLNAVMVIEHIMEHVALHLGLDPVAVKERNFLQSIPPALASNSDQQYHHGGLCHSTRPLLRPSNPQPASIKTALGREIAAEQFTLPRVWEGVKHSAQYAARAAAVKAFNDSHVWQKRGISINPCRFDSQPPANVAAVSILNDGSVLLTHGGLEVGQGLSTKAKQMAAYELGQLLPEDQRPLSMDFIRVNDSRSDIVPNAGPTWSSTGSESTAAAVQNACAQLRQQLAPFLDTKGSSSETWQATVAATNQMVGYMPSATLLSAYGWYDSGERPHSKTGRRPKAVLDVKQLNYSSFGAAVSEVQIDVLTGEKLILRSDILFDCGNSFNPAVDVGQVEGAFIMGLGMMAQEQVIINEDTGKLMTDSTWNYKIPTAICIPQQLNVAFLKDSPNPRGIMSSKASGEPSLLLSVSVLHACRNAAAAARSQLILLSHPCPPTGCNSQSQSPTSTLRSSGAFSLADERSSDTGGESGDESAVTQNSQSAVGRAVDSTFMLEAPATASRLKQACGHVSVAAVLRAAVDRSNRDSHDGSWLLV